MFFPSSKGRRRRLRRAEAAGGDRKSQQPQQSAVQQEVAAAAIRLLTAPPRRGGATAKLRLALCIKTVQKSSVSERIRSLVFVQNYKKKEPFFRNRLCYRRNVIKMFFPSKGRRGRLRRAEAAGGNRKSQQPPQSAVQQDVAAAATRLLTAPPLGEEQVRKNTLFTLKYLTSNKV